MKRKLGGGISRRLALKFIGGGTLGVAGLFYGMSRNDLLTFLDSGLYDKASC